MHYNVGTGEQRRKCVGAAVEIISYSLCKKEIGKKISRMQSYVVDAN